jgi:hypothetical protein
MEQLAQPMLKLLDQGSFEVDIEFKIEFESEFKT